MLPDVNSWAVIHTHARCEKVLAEFLKSRGVIYFLPLLKKRRQYGRHIRESQIPMFSGYLFYDYDGITRREILKTNKVAQIIEPVDKGQLKRELENIDRAILSNSVLQLSDFNAPGIRVMVTGGPLAGIEGEFVKRKNKTKLVIKIHILGQAIETDIDEALVKKL